MQVKYGSMKDCGRGLRRQLLPVYFFQLDTMFLFIYTHIPTLKMSIPSPVAHKTAADEGRFFLQ